MAVCKRCGCAIPLGQKDCDMCQLTSAIAPSSTLGAAPQLWQPPANVAPVQYASSASWASGAGTTVPAPVATSTAITQSLKRIRFAWGAAAVVGCLQAGLGLIAELVPVPDLLRVGINWGGVVEGSIYLVLAIFIWRLSRVALVIATILYALDALAYLASGHATGVWIIIRASVLIALVQAYFAMSLIHKVRRQEASAPAPTLPSDQARAA